MPDKERDVHTQGRDRSVQRLAGLAKLIAKTVLQVLWDARAGYADEEKASFLVSTVVESIHFALSDVENIAGPHSERIVVDRKLDLPDKTDVHPVFFC